MEPLFLWIFEHKKVNVLCVRNYGSTDCTFQCSTTYYLPGRTYTIL